MTSVSHSTLIPRNTAARAASRSRRPWSTAALVMARLPDCGLNRKEREESSDRSEDTEKLVTRAHSPPAVRTIVTFSN